MATVEYRGVQGFPGYRVGDDGSVWSCFRRAARGKQRTLDGPWIRLKPQPGNSGHLRIQLYRFVDRFAPRVLVHHLVLAAFVGPCPDGHEACHGDGDPSNNKLSNLRWGTRIENRADRTRHGRGRSWAKLTATQVTLAKQMRADGHTWAEIGATIGVSDTQARNVVTGKQWKGAK